MKKILIGLLLIASIVACDRLLAGDISGKVLFEGNAPKAVTIPMNSESRLHG